jgi:hypothetical protein
MMMQVSHSGRKIDDYDRFGTIHRIDQRLRQVVSDAQDKWFGGLTVLL